MSVLQVSVVLPLFGNHRAAQALPAVCRAWLKQDVPCEVVVAVAEGTKVPFLGDGAARGLIRIVSADRDLLSPGPLRNLAVAASRAPVLYLSDADVAPLGDFAGQALELLEDRAVIQPWMYRLVNPAEVSAGPPFELSSQTSVCHVSADARGRLIPLNGERITRLGRHLMYAEPPAGLGWRNEDGTPWRAFPFHWGGMMVRRETFDAVGGYCTRYVGWGCEDDDLIAKLDSRVGVVRAWKMPGRRLTCLHFEHPRSHTFAPFKANQEILAERIAAGADAMIKADC